MRWNGSSGVVRTWSNLFPAIEVYMVITQPLVTFALKNVLLATDFSEGTETALKYARAIARKHSARVHAIHVTGPDSYHLLQPEALAITFKDLDHASNVTGELRNLLRGLPNEVPLHRGEIWEVINDVIVRNEIDLLVVATHGRTGLPRFIYGSVAEELFRNVSCPVLTIGPDVKTCSVADYRVDNILLATDFDPLSAAPSYASHLANDLHAKLTVLHVAADDDENNKRQVKDGIEGLQAIFTEETALWHEPEFVVEYGDAATNILEVADLLNPDIIVLGARRPEPAKIVSHLPWDTAAKIIARSNRPVLTVPEGNIIRPPASFEFEAAMRGL
jgi:nucleotide-binding universal stress UspA family protein